MWGSVENRAKECTVHTSLGFLGIVLVVLCYNRLISLSPWKDWCERFIPWNTGCLWDTTVINKVLVKKKVRFCVGTGTLI